MKLTSFQDTIAWPSLTTYDLLYYVDDDEDDDDDKLQVGTILITKLKVS